MNGIVSHSFRLNLTILKFVGAYPSKKYPTLHRIYAISLFVLSMTAPFVLGTLHFVFNGDLTPSNYDDYIILGIIFYTVKVLLFLKNSGEIRKCVEYFDGCVAANAGQRLIIEECVFICQRNSLVFFGGCFVGLVGVIGPRLLEGKTQKLPLNVWLPDDWKETPPIYNCIYFLLLLGTAYTNACFTIDSLIGGLSLHASAQLQILGHCLRFLDQDENHNSDCGKVISQDLSIYKKIKMCLQNYQNVVNFVHIYQNCLSPVVFVQFVGSVLIIGLCCFQLSVMEVDIRFFVTLLCFGILFFELFFYCYYGTLLIEENDAVSRAIYTSRWYEYDEQSKKALLLLMTRLQKSLFVTAGKLLTLSLETFTSILKRSYSLLAVLKNY